MKKRTGTAMKTYKCNYFVLFLNFCFIYSDGDPCMYEEFYRGLQNHVESSLDSCKVS